MRRVLYTAVCWLGLAGAVRLLPLVEESWERGHQLPDLLDRRLLPQARIFVQVQATTLGALQLQVQPAEWLAPTTGPAVRLQPGQRARLHAPLEPARAGQLACPLPVSLLVVRPGDGAVVGRASLALKCKELTDRFSFVYLDADGSPQMAAAKPPEAGRCAEGCGVLLSTHGMDVTAQRQADCYRPKPGLWVLAPHGRGTHGFNWQGPGHWSVLAALRHLASLAAQWRDGAARLDDRWRVVFTGHSNGGYGAWMLGSLYPDWTVAVAPLSGMASIGTTEQPRPPGLAQAAWELIDHSVELYRAGKLAANLAGKLFIARSGLDDRVIDPRATLQMARLLEETGVRWQPDPSGHRWDAADQRASVVLKPGKGHWWWDTDSPNDGGVMDDPELRQFWADAAAEPPPYRPDGGRVASFECAELAGCGTKFGVAMLQQLRAHRSSRIELERFDESWSVSTSNLARLRIERAPLSSSEQLLIQLDGQPALRMRAANMIVCREDDHPTWRLCSQQCNQTGCCQMPARTAERAAGPIRRVLAASFGLVYGTASSKAVSEEYRHAAVQFANAWYELGGGSAVVLPDTDVENLQTVQNLIVFGGPHGNTVARNMSHPGLTLLQPTSRGRLEAGFELAGCNFTQPDSSLVSLAPWPASNRSASGGLAVLVTGTTLAGFRRAVRLMRSNLFETNRWQHRLPEFVVVQGRPAEQSFKSLDGLVATGYWGNSWEYVPESSFVKC